jgi:hypothetical protein
LQYLDNNIIRTLEKCHPEVVGRISGSNAEFNIFIREFLIGGIHVIDLDAHMVITVCRQWRVRIDGFAVRSHPEVNRGSVQIQGGTVGPAELLANDKPGSYRLNKKVDGGFKIAAQQMDMMETDRSCRIP